MIKNILFDLDGTLTDSGPGIMNCAKEALRHFNMPIPGEEVLRTIIGPPLQDSMIRLGVSPENVPEAIRVFRKRYSTLGKYENSPYPGIQELLAKLKADGHKLYVATSKPENMALDIMDHFDLAQYFTCICGASLDGTRITKSAVINYLLDQCGQQDNLLMVGDTAFDVLGAAEHGIDTVGVSWGYGHIDEIKEAGAVDIAQTMDELYEILSR